MSSTDRARLAMAARQAAARRLIELHRDDFDRIYREEATALGIKPHRSRADKVAALEAQLAALKEQS